MQKTSCFNKCLFGKNIKRFAPVWAIITIVAFLVTVALLLSKSDMYYPNSAKEDFYTIATDILPVCFMLHASISVLCVFGYMFKQNALETINSLPVKKYGVFITNYLSGLVMMLIPYVVCILTFLCFVISKGCFDGEAFLWLLLSLISQSIFFFSFGTIAAVLTGTYVSYFALYGLFQFLGVLTEYIIRTLLSGFYLGVSSDSSLMFNFLSPLFFIYKKIDYSIIWYKSYDRINEVILNGGLWYLAILFAGILLFAGSLLIYKNNKCESSGEVFTRNGVKKVLIVWLSLLGAVIGGMLLYDIVFNSFSVYYLSAALIPFCVISLAITYTGAEMLVRRSSKVFKRKYFVKLLIMAASIIIGIIVIDSDVLNISRQIPKVSAIEEVSLRMNGDEYVFDSNDSAEIEKLTEFLNYISENRKEIRKQAAEIRNKYGYLGKEGKIYYFNLEYDLSNGRRVYKSYNIPVAEKELYHLSSVCSKLDLLLKDEGFIKNGALHYMDTLGVIDVYSFSLGSKSMTAKDREEFLDIYVDEYVDFMSQKGLMDRVQPFCDINLTGRDKEEQYMYFIDIYEDMEKSLDFLIEKQYISSQDLVNKAEEFAK